MTDYENPRSKTIESSLQVIRQTKFRGRVAGIRSLRNLKFEDRAVRAKEWVIGYATECLAREVYKQAGEPSLVFALHVQACFEAVGETLDRHLQPGLDEIGRRRALLERAEVFCRLSPHFGEHIDRHDTEAMADAVNEREARRVLYKFLFCRDRLAALPAYTGGPDEDFTPSAAKELIDQLERLYRVLHDCVTRMKPIFDDPQRDSVPLNPKAIADQIRQVGADIAARLRERMLQRVIERQEERHQCQATWEGPTKPSSYLIRPQTSGP